MSILLIACAAGFGAIGSSLLSYRRRRLAVSRTTVTEPTSADPPVDLTAPFFCHLGDVILPRMEGDEVWLTSVSVFFEEQAALALFLSSDGARAIFVRRNESEILCLQPMVAVWLEGLREPPLSAEIGGHWLERRSRKPFAVQSSGEGSNSGWGGNALVAEYGSGDGESLVLVVGDFGAFAFEGRSLGESQYDHLPSGEKSRG